MVERAGVIIGIVLLLCKLVSMIVYDDGVVSCIKEDQRSNNKVLGVGSYYQRKERKGEQ